MIKRGLFIARALILVMAIATGCGGGDDDATSPTSTTASAATQSSGWGCDAAAGQKIAQASCMTCHTIDASTLVGPSWKGLYGRDVEFEDGTTVTADDAYIRQSILDPNSQVVKGFPAAMPTFNGILTDEQITNIRTLQERTRHIDRIAHPRGMCPSG